MSRNLAPEIAGLTARYASPASAAGVAVVPQFSSGCASSSHFDAAGRAAINLAGTSGCGSPPTRRPAATCSSAPAPRQCCALRPPRCAADLRWRHAGTHAGGAHRPGRPQHAGRDPDARAGRREAAGDRAAGCLAGRRRCRINYERRRGQQGRTVEACAGGVGSSNTGIVPAIKRAYFWAPSGAQIILRAAISRPDSHIDLK